MHERNKLEKVIFELQVWGEIFGDGLNFLWEKTNLVGKLKARNTYSSIKDTHPLISQFYNQLYGIQLEPATMRFSAGETGKYDYVKDQLTWPRRFSYQDILGREAAVMNLAELESMRYFRNARRDLDIKDKDSFWESFLQEGTDTYAVMMVMGWLGFKVVPAAIRDYAESQDDSYFILGGKYVSGINPEALTSLNIGHMTQFAEFLRLPTKDAIEKLGKDLTDKELGAIVLHPYVSDFLRNNPDYREVAHINTLPDLALPQASTKLLPSPE